MFRCNRQVRPPTYLPYNTGRLTAGNCRNGGHINPPLYHDYAALKKTYGEDTARRMVKFRLAHRKEMQRIAEEEDILKESQVRETEHIDVFTCPKTYAEAKENLRIWKAAMPNESSSFGFVDAEEAISVRFQSIPDVPSALNWIECSQPCRKHLACSLGHGCNTLSLALLSLSSLYRSVS